MTTHRLIQIFTLLDTLESMLRMSEGAATKLRRIGNLKGAEWYTARSVRLARLIKKCKLRLALEGEQEKAIAWWLKLADDEERMIELGLTYGSAEPFIARAETYRRAAKAIEIKRDTGVGVCSCCFKPFGGKSLVLLTAEDIEKGAA
jgi:hypothetical protein